MSSGRGSDQPASGQAERIKDSVRRDLEWLLNSKRPPLDFPGGLNELDQSLMTYGLPDITSLSPGDIDKIAEFQKTLADVIRDFEPRLTEVRVGFTPIDQDQHQASLHYRIDALLRLDPAPEPIVFDTVLDLGNRAFRVNREGS